jgi:hypothetical protein
MVTFDVNLVQLLWSKFLILDRWLHFRSGSLAASIDFLCLWGSVLVGFSARFFP